MAVAKFFGFVRHNIERKRERGKTILNRQLDDPAVPARLRKPVFLVIIIETDLVPCGEMSYGRRETACVFASEWA